MLVVDTGRITLKTEDSARGDYDVSNLATRGAEVYYAPTNTYFAQHQDVLHLWCQFDTDNSGSISHDELTVAIREVSGKKLRAAENAAMRANHSVRPHDTFKVLESLGFVVKVRGRKNRHGDIAPLMSII